jgi:DnaJ-class molecular chaperone
MMVHLLVAAVVALVVYVPVVLVNPLHRCPRCKGRRAVASGRGMAPCGRCKGTGKAMRRGARLVHRAVRSRRNGTTERK